MKWLKNNTKIHFILLGLGIILFFLVRRDYAEWTVRCILVSLILIVAGIYDWNTCEIPDYLHVLLLLVGLINIQFIPALLGFLLVPLPFLAAAIVTGGKIGGGDIKLMAAMGFCIGVTGGILMMVSGLLLAIGWSKVFGNGRKSLPLAPFLAAGGIMILLL